MGSVGVISIYTLGARVRLITNPGFTLDGSLLDPTTVKVVIKNPLSVETTLNYGTDAELIRQSLGVYYVDVTLDTPGEWGVRFEGHGAVEAVAETSAYVKHSRF